VLIVWLVLVLLACLAPRGARLPLTVRRKYFHVISLVALVPPAVLRSSGGESLLSLSSASSSALARLASGGAMAALVTLELLRYGGLARGIGTCAVCLLLLQLCNKISPPQCCALTTNNNARDQMDSCASLSTNETAAA
jgi:hypothetical protein